MAFYGFKKNIIKMSYLDKKKKNYINHNLYMY